MRGTGTVVRLGIAGQVALGVILASAIAIGVTWLSERPGIRLRVDLTAAGENSFHEETLRKLEALPGRPSDPEEHYRLTGDRAWLNLEEEAKRAGDGDLLGDLRTNFEAFIETHYTLEIDVFFHALPPPMTGIGSELQGLFFQKLVLAKDLRRDIIEMTRHEIEGSKEGRIAASRRAHQLGFKNEGDVSNTVVFSYAGRRATVRLYGNEGDIAEVDFGSLGGQSGVASEPRIVERRVEEAFVRALLKVSSLGAPRVLFSWGHNERDIYAEGRGQISRLKQALLSDGFSLGRWDSDEVGPVPTDCDVLAIIGPQDPFSEVEQRWIREFIWRGGRLIAAPSNGEREGDGGLPDILAEYGILRQAGIVCMPYRGTDGVARDGMPECLTLSIRSQHMAKHSITEPLRRGDRGVFMTSTRPLVRGEGPEGSVLFDLLESDRVTWSDLPGPSGYGDVIYKEGEELTGPFALAVIARFPVAKGPVAEADSVTARRDARVLAFGTPEVFSDLFFSTNRDLLMNSFNWASNREFRLSISNEDPEKRILPLGEGEELLWVNRVAVIGLPLICLALGLLRWFMRRSI